MDELEFIKKIAIEAGNIIMQYYGKSEKQDKELKADNTYVTLADKTANDHIISQIKEQFPEDGILSEETADNKERLTKKRTWIIDPLDGTHHFIKHETEFTVAIALVQNNRPILAATYKPYDKGLYFAKKGAGAFFEQNGQITKLHISDIQEIAQLKVTASQATAREVIKSFIEDSPFKTFEFRGSSCYKFCLVANQEYDAYLRDHRRLKEWDICGGDLIVHEAGGKVTDFNDQLILYNEDNVIKTNGMLVSNTVCHQTMLELIKSRLNK